MITRVKGKALFFVPCYKRKKENRKRGREREREKNIKGRGGRKKKKEECKNLIYFIDTCRLGNF